MSAAERVRLQRAQAVALANGDGVLEPVTFQQPLERWDVAGLKNKQKEQVWVVAEVGGSIHQKGASVCLWWGGLKD